MTLLCRFVLRPLSTTWSWVYRLLFSFQRADFTRGTHPTCHEPAHQFGVLVCGFMTRRMCSPRKVQSRVITPKPNSAQLNPRACCTHGPCSRLTPPAFLTHACPVPNTHPPCSQHTLGPIPTLVTDSTFILCTLRYRSDLGSSPALHAQALHIGNPTIMMPLGLLLPLAIFWGSLDGIKKRSLQTLNPKP